MAIAAKISSTELTDQVTSRFVDKYLEARLIDAFGTTYEPGITNDATFLGFEVAAGLGGYAPVVFSYGSGDVSVYGDDGVALNTKATVFAHDGSTDTVQFSHVALVWSSGNATTLGSVSSTATDEVDGTYTNIPVDATTGSGVGLTVDLTITSGVPSLVINKAGSGYAENDEITILGGTLAGLGALATDSGNISSSVSTIAPQASSAGQVLSVAQTSSRVSLTGGNEAVFYWNLKQFGFYNTSS